MNASGRLLLGALACAGACRGSTFADGVFRKDEVAYRVGALPAAWRVVSAREGDVVFHHARGGTIFTHASCEEAPDAPLDALLNRLLFGVEVRREARRAIAVDGREALRTEVLGTLDGVPIALDAVILMKHGCVYDLVLIGDEESFAARRQDFEAFVLSFTTEVRGA